MAATRTFIISAPEMRGALPFVDSYSSLMARLFSLCARTASRNASSVIIRAGKFFKGRDEDAQDLLGELD